ncbi:MAG TPA: enoyl-CoA hydratase-related protein [Stackebrandtia sp.]|jgi:methylglutaconyl-CoA hydratase|uniref:enoyl-CoA hydratase-related protein n=1 Tax=Stackebrandtia sp. TaxID=2023065 RepID=UPI002D5CB324|nr:enoyl-CoA hydratase-related protein [Stackebrandtia sp.]HZE37818.1 enoyl-CoA hydratase-related protein [Stackebrandtia sp.]
MPDDTTDELVTYDVDRGVATLRLNSEPNRNALSTPLMTKLLEHLDAAAADAAVRVVVLGHTGRVFCSGADLKETAAAREAGEVPAAMLTDVLARLWEFDKPVIARVGGPARAGGLGLVAAADIAVCAAEATFAFTEVRIGVVPAVISAPVLRRLRPRDAAELYLTGTVFDGRRAESIGLVTRAVPAVDLDIAVAGYAEDLALGAPGALAGAKRLLRRGDADIRAELAELSKTSAEFFLSEEGREGVAAFAEKRDASWVVK